MARRPYFKHRIDQIEALVRSSGSNLDTLTAIQHELTFRNRSKARAMAAKVDELISVLSGDASMPPPSECVAIRRSVSDTPTAPANQPPLLNNPTPARVAVECAHCKGPNFVSTLEGITQHLSCSSCKHPYEARFVYGVMRTTFQVGAAKPGSASTKWAIAALVFLLVLALITK